MSACVQSTGLARYRHRGRLPLWLSDRGLVVVVEADAGHVSAATAVNAVAAISHADVEQGTFRTLPPGLKLVDAIEWFSRAP